MPCTWQPGQHQLWHKVTNLLHPDALICITVLILKASISPPWSPPFVPMTSNAATKATLYSCRRMHTADATSSGHPHDRCRGLRGEDVARGRKHQTQRCAPGIAAAHQPPPSHQGLCRLPASRAGPGPGRHPASRPSERHRGRRLARTEAELQEDLHHCETRRRQQCWACQADTPRCRSRITW